MLPSVEYRWAQDIFNVGQPLSKGGFNHNDISLPNQHVFTGNFSTMGMGSGLSGGIAKGIKSDINPNTSYRWMGRFFHQLISPFSNFISIFLGHILYPSL
jgi:hypothetical protein